MVQAIPRSKARLTERQQFWLDHLRVCREQGHTLRGYLRHVFTELPKAQSLADIEALLPTRLDPAALARDSLQDLFPAARQ